MTTDSATHSVPLHEAHTSPLTVSITRFVRYVGVSVVSFVLAQLGLALAYGVLYWPVLPAVIVSLAVSVGPAYLLHRRFVWPHPQDGRSRAPEVRIFAALAVAGTLITYVVVSAAVHVARSMTMSHLTLSIVVNISSIAATGMVWITRYFILDRFVFGATSHFQTLAARSR